MTRQEAQRRYRQSAQGRTTRKANRKSEAGKAERRRYKETLTTKRMLKHTFTGVDGEGWTDPNGTHHYMTLTIGTRTLYTGKPLTAEQCLGFIADTPVVPNRYLVGYFFDYDVTMILRDMAQDDPELTRRLFNVDRKFGSLVWWHGFGIEYLPKKRFTVKRWTDDNSSKSVTVHDVQGFYQCSFVDALTKFKIGTPDERASIAAMKAQRSDFTAEQAPEIIAYSEHECKLLAQLVASLRDATHHAGVNASPYEGPGNMARRALEKYYGKEKHALGMSRTPLSVHTIAGKAYYGGRFETFAHGPIKGTVYEYDLKSAYPAAMLQLPCLIHGIWKRGIHSPIYIAKAEWNLPFKPSSAMPFPVRRKDGSVYYPSRGEGWYWSYEIEPIRTLYSEPGDSVETGGIEVHSIGAWSYINNCGCQPFDWVRDIFNERLAMEAESKGSGIALKLMLNTLYGKMAQQRPVPGTFFNMVYASMITSITRAKIYQLYLNGARVIMFATDAVFTLGPIDGLKTGDHLGDWELANTFDDLTIFQPGVYFDGDQADDIVQNVSDHFHDM